MELELERMQWEGYQSALDTTIYQEETLEAIVPDAHPDILKICSVEGQSCLTGKEAMDGRIEVTGTARMFLIYLPEGNDELHHMEVTIPYCCNIDCAAATTGCRVLAVPQIQNADARLLNPRKVLLRANLAIDVQVYAPVSEDICAGVANRKDAGIEQLIEDCSAYTTICVQEKSFTYSDESAFPSGKPPAKEILKNRVSVQCSEIKVIGSKLIFKGTATLVLLCSDTDGGLFSVELELPFSQIMDVGGVGETPCCQLRIAVTNLNCSLEDGDGRTVSVSMELLAQAVIGETRQMQMLSDVYSTAFDLITERQTYSFSSLLDSGEKEITVRELIETGTIVREVVDICAVTGAVTQKKEGERLTMAVQVEVTALYQSEDGEWGTVTRPIQITTPLELPEGALCSCKCACTSPAFATAAAGGLEVRFPIRFFYTALSTKSMTGISNISIDESAPVDHTAKPSIVLRMVGAGERLWDIAKSYRTTSEDIMQANGLEGECLPDGQLLLIPGKR